MIKEFHPDLLPKIRELTIYANRRVLSRTLTGNWASMIKGRGIEFAGYRQYTVGTDASSIDWKASLRARKLLVKELTEERSLNVLLMVDTSESMVYGSKDFLKAEYAAEVATSIAFAALRAGDAVGLVMFGDCIKEFAPPGIGTQQHHIIVSNLLKGELYGGPLNLSKVINQVMDAMKQRGLIIIISDFIGVSDRLKQELEVASSKFEVLGIMVRDPRDRRLPRRAGEYVLQDPYTKERIVIDCRQYYEPYKKYVEEEEEHVRRAFRAIKSDVLLLETDEDFTKAIMKFFHKQSLQMEH